MGTRGQNKQSAPPPLLAAVQEGRRFERIPSDKRRPDVKRCVAVL